MNDNKSRFFANFFGESGIEMILIVQNPGGQNLGKEIAEQKKDCDTRKRQRPGIRKGSLVNDLHPLCLCRQAAPACRLRMSSTSSYLASIFFRRQFKTKCCPRGFKILSLSTVFRN